MSTGSPSIASRKEVTAQPVTGLMGELGGYIITDTSAVTGDFSCLYPITDSVIASATTPGFTGSLAGVTLAKGIPFYGQCTAVTLTSGSLVAYTRTSAM